MVSSFLAWALCMSMLPNNQDFQFLHQWIETYISQDLPFGCLLDQEASNTDHWN